MESKDLEVSSLHKLVASQRITHTPVEQILKDLNLTRYKFNKVIASKEYKEVLREMSDEATSHAISTWKASVSDLISEAHRVIKEKLQENDLKAVEIVLKSIGVSDQETQVGPTNIQVLLPNFQDTPKHVDIEVKND